MLSQKENGFDSFWLKTPPPPPQPLRPRGLHGDTFYNLYSFIFKVSHDSNQNVNDWQLLFLKSSTS